VFAIDIIAPRTAYTCCRANNLFLLSTGVGPSLCCGSSVAAGDSAAAAGALDHAMASSSWQKRRMTTAAAATAPLTPTTQLHISGAYISSSIDTIPGIHIMDRLVQDAADADSWYITTITNGVLRYSAVMRNATQIAPPPASKMPTTFLYQAADSGDVFFSFDDVIARYTAHAASPQITQILDGTDPATPFMDIHSFVAHGGNLFVAVANGGLFDAPSVLWLDLTTMDLQPLWSIPCLRGRAILSLTIATSELLYACYGSVLAFNISNLTDPPVTVAPLDDECPQPIQAGDPEFESLQIVRSQTFWRLGNVPV